MLNSIKVLILVFKSNEFMRKTLIVKIFVVLSVRSLTKMYYLLENFLG